MRRTRERQPNFNVKPTNALKEISSEVAYSVRKLYRKSLIPATILGSATLTATFSLAQNDRPIITAGKIGLSLLLTLGTNNAFKYFENPKETFISRSKYATKKRFTVAAVGFVSSIGLTLIPVSDTFKSAANKNISYESKHANAHQPLFSLSNPKLVA